MTTTGTFKNKLSARAGGSTARVKVPPSGAVGIPGSGKTLAALATNHGSASFLSLPTTPRMAPTGEQVRRLKEAKLTAAVKSKKKKNKEPNARVQRYLKSIEPQLHERGKSTLLFKGIQCSQQMSNVLKELRALQAPNAKLLSKTNPITPFTTTAGGKGNSSSTNMDQSIEFLTTKNDCALFAMASTNKKRPNNLVLGRTFDRQVLDLCELGVLRFKSILNGDYPGSIPKKRIGSKPLLLFCGDLWQTCDEYSKLQNLLTDFYRGDVVDKLVANGLDHLIMFTLVKPPKQSSSSSSSVVSSPLPPPVLLHQRTYFLQLRKSADSNSNAAAAAAASTGLSSPVPTLENCGPDFDFVLRRTQWASPELARAARKLPAPVVATLRRSSKNNNNNATGTKKKNQSTNLFGETLGRLHLTKQDLDHMGGRKAKALRRAEKAEALEERALIEGELTKEANQEEPIRQS